MGKITLLSLGDIWLARFVADEIIKKGSHHPFVHIASYLHSADIVFGNLESPFSTRGTPTKNKDVVAKAAPSSLDGLVYAGINVVSLANNHIMDFGTEALSDTLRFLKQKGINHVGAGMTKTEAREPLLLTINGISLSLHAYLCWGEASRSGLGPAGVIKSAIREDLQQTRPQSDFVIVALHGGVDFQDHPTLQMIKLAHWIIDQGADVVIGHHPHVIHGIEKYKNGLIAYSLGNFIFDSYDVELKEERARQGIILKLDIHKTEALNFQYETIPVCINDQYQAELVLQDEKKDAILRRLSQLSSTEFLSEKRGYISVDERAIVGKIRNLMKRKFTFIVTYTFRNFFRLLYLYLPAFFRLVLRRLKRFLKGKRG
jgi:poly-gamma-glutamate synthesis protein (capsule biosynthesis protein)